MGAADHPVSEPLQRRPRQAAVCTQKLGGGKHRSGRPEHPGPPEPQECFLHGLEFAAGLGLGGDEGGLADDAAREEAAREGNTPHVETGGPERLLPLSDDQFGASAPDIQHEPAAVPLRKQGADSQIDEPRFLSAGDDLHPTSESFRRSAEQCLPVLHLPEDVRAHRARLAGRDIPDAFPDPGECSRCPPPRRGFHRLVPDARGQPHGLLDAIHHLDVLAVNPGHGDVEAAGAEVHRREEPHRKTSFGGHG